MNNMKTWTAKTGEVLEISKMETSHINSCIQMMHRNGFCSKKTLRSYLRCNYGSLGDGAQMAFDREIDLLAGKLPSQLVDDLEEELDKRLAKETT